jgi:hypothetical protein
LFTNPNIKSNQETLIYRVAQPPKNPSPVGEGSRMRAKKAEMLTG